MAPHMNDGNDMILTSSDINNDDVDVNVNVARRRGSGSNPRSSDRTTTTTTATTTARMDVDDDTDIEIDDDTMANDRSFLKRKWWQPFEQNVLKANMTSIREDLHTVTPPPTTKPHESAGRTSLPSPPSMCLPPVAASATPCLPQRPSLCPSVVAPTPPPRSQQQQETTPGRRKVIAGGRQYQQERQERHAKASTSAPKSVHFAPLVKKKTIKHYKDFSDEEFFLTWLSSEELHDILQGCIKTVKMMVRGELILEDVDGLCVRGLEFKTPEGSRERKANKAKGLQAVLMEQAAQKAKGGGGGGANASSSTSALRLSMVYRDATRHVRRKARALAQNDEQAARTIYNESNVNTSAGTVDCRLDIVVCWNGDEAMPSVPVPSTPTPKTKGSRKTGSGPQPRRFATSSPTTVYDPLDGWSSPLVALEQQEQQYNQN